MLPSAAQTKLFRRYQRIRANLPKREGEVKGSLLKEEHFQKVIELLRRNGALFCASVIDLADHSPSDIEKHKSDGIQALADNLANGHTPELRSNVKSLQQRMEAFSQPLYTQMMVTLELLHRTLEEAIGYHCQRNPKELEAFHWVVDAKQVNHVTDWEKWWRDTLIVWLQAMSIKRPRMLFTFGDYRYFQRFLIHESPQHLKAVAPPTKQGQPVGIDLQLVFGEHFSFSSDAIEGLELVDIVTNCLRRAMVGNLDESGWASLNNIMIHRSDHTIRPVSLHYRDKLISRPYSEVLYKLRIGGRSMITDKNSNSSGSI